MIWTVMIVCGLMTFATRFVMFSDIAPKKLPQWSSDLLGFVPVSVLTAILLPTVLVGAEGTLEIEGNTRLPAAILAVLIAFVTRSVLATIIGGLAAMWALTWLFY